MKYFIYPVDSEIDEKSSWEKDNTVSLGGYFYDYLKSMDGIFIGVRYYIDNESDIQNTFIFKEFEKDHRFSFDFKNKSVDILLKMDCKEDFERKIFYIDLAQDFGGDYVLINNKRYGILFEI